jgi:hypothetical protein
VIEKAAMNGHFFQQEMQSGEDAFVRVLRRDVSALMSNAKRREPKTGGCDAGNDRIISTSHIAAVFYEAGVRMGLLEKEE